MRVLVEQAVFMIYSTIFDEETRLAMNRTLRNEKERDYSYFLMDMMNCLMNKKMSFQWFIKY